MVQLEYPENNASEPRYEGGGTLTTDNHTHEEIARHPNGSLSPIFWRNDARSPVWACRRIAKLRQRCRALLALQPGSKACDLPACLPSVGMPAFSPPRARDPDFIFQVVVATLTLLLDQLQKFARFGRKPRDQVRHDRYTSGQTSSGEKGRSPDVL